MEMNNKLNNYKYYIVEQTASDRRRINSVYVQSTGGCVTKVLIKINNNNVELTKQMVIEYAIMENNDKIS